MRISYWRSDVCSSDLNECGRLLDYFSKKGVHYTKAEASETGVSIGGALVADTSPESLDAALAGAGYSFETVKPGAGDIAIILLAILALGALSGATYGPVAALLTELFPSRIRYSSMSIPYHIGPGYFGGFLPFISQTHLPRRSENCRLGTGLCRTCRSWLAPFP